MQLQKWWLYNISIIIQQIQIHSLQWIFWVQHTSIFLYCYLLQDKLQHAVRGFYLSRCCQSLSDHLWHFPWICAPLFDNPRMKRCFKHQRKSQSEMGKKLHSGKTCGYKERSPRRSVEKEPKNNNWIQSNCCHRSHPFPLTQHWLFSRVAAFFCLRDG
jgi:hypothetical protein